MSTSTFVISYAYTVTYITDKMLFLPMPALPQRPGKAGRSIASKASRNQAIRDYERR